MPNSLALIGGGPSQGGSQVIVGANWHAYPVPLGDTNPLTLDHPAGAYWLDGSLDFYVFGHAECIGLVYECTSFTGSGDFKPMGVGTYTKVSTNTSYQPRPGTINWQRRLFQINEADMRATLFPSATWNNWEAWVNQSVVAGWRSLGVSSGWNVTSNGTLRAHYAIYKGTI